MTVGADEDVAEAAAALAAALGVCLYNAGCGTHRRCDTAGEAAEWCADHKQATGHRTEVWAADVDALVVVNPLARAVHAYRRDLEQAERSMLNDPNWGKAPVPHWLYEAVRERVEAGTASADLRAIFPNLVPISPMEETPGERQHPRDQPIPIGHRRRRVAKGKGKRR